MADRLSSFRTWVTFAGCVLVVGVLYWAQAVLVPVSLAILITFVLTPPVIWLQRRIGRAAAVLRRGDARVLRPRALRRGRSCAR